MVRKKQINSNGGDIKSFVNSIKEKALNVATKVMCPDAIRFPNEHHMPCYSYCGPGTHLEKRLELEKQGISLPINDTDRACRSHDIDYHNFRVKKANGYDPEKLREEIRASDERLIEAVKNNKNAKLDEKIIQQIIWGKTKVEDAHLLDHNKFVGDLTDRESDKLIDGGRIKSKHNIYKMTETYCLKCRKRTKDVNQHKIDNRVASTCAVCGGKKSRFVKKHK